MLEAQGIRKAYGGIVALHGAGITARAGSVHALLGENGAGKSTLVKVIAGAVRPDAGTLLLDGREVRFASTAEAARAGVAVVSQEINLFPELDVLSNLFPMREPRRGALVDRAAMRRRAAPVLAELGLDVTPRQTVGELTLAERQLVEIAKALLTKPRVLILDEPTSALEARSVDTLLGVLRVLRERQVAVIFVSHILDEVMQLCDEVTVLRDGRPVLEAEPLAGLTVPKIVEAMLGQRHRGGLAAPGPGDGRVDTGLALAAAPGEDRRLVLEHVTVRPRLEDVSLTAHAGEVVGLAGLAGSGHRTVLEVVAGLRRSAGRVVLPGGRPTAARLRGAIRAGVAIVPGDRKRLGLMLDKPVWENVAQVRAIALVRAGRLISRRRLRERALEHATRLQVRTPTVDERASQLSGGNQQKVVFAKWLDAQPSVLLLDDPTRGVDVAAKSEMHALVRSAADTGAVVLLCSTDVDELADLCDRVLVFYEGRICADLAGDRLDAHAVLEAMNTGLTAGRT